MMIDPIIAETEKLELQIDRQTIKMLCVLFVLFALTIVSLFLACSSIAQTPVPSETFKNAIAAASMTQAASDANSAKNYAFWGITIQSVTAVMLAFLTYMGLRLHGTMQHLETNTNSIKDALILSTAEKSYAEGVLEGKAQVAHRK